MALVPVVPLSSICVRPVASGTRHTGGHLGVNKNVKMCLSLCPVSLQSAERGFLDTQTVTSSERCMFESLFFLGLGWLQNVSVSFKWTSSFVQVFSSVFFSTFSSSRDPFQFGWQMSDDSQMSVSFLSFGRASVSFGLDYHRRTVEVSYCIAAV